MVEIRDEEEEVRLLEEHEKQSNESDQKFKNDGDESDDKKIELELNKKDDVNEVDVKLYVRGKGPVEEFKCKLGGWDRDRIDLLQIMEDHGLKALYAYNPSSSARGLRLRFNPLNGLSLFPYRATVVCLDGDPKDPLLMPITKTVILLAVIALLLSWLMRNPPEWIEQFQFLKGGSLPWTIAIVAVVVSRLRKKLLNFIKR